MLWVNDIGFGGTIGVLCVYMLDREIDLLNNPAFIYLLHWNFNCILRAPVILVSNICHHTPPSVAGKASVADKAPDSLSLGFLTSSECRNLIRWSRFHLTLWHFKELRILCWRKKNLFFNNYCHFFSYPCCDVMNHNPDSCCFLFLRVRGRGWGTRQSYFRFWGPDKNFF